MEAGEHGLLDPVERKGLSSDPVGNAVEGAGNLSNAVRRVVASPLGNRVVVGNDLEDDGIVRVQPKRDLLIPRSGLEGNIRQRGDIAVKVRAASPERPVVDKPVANVHVQDLIEHGVIGQHTRWLLRIWRRHQDERT